MRGIRRVLDRILAAVCIVIFIAMVLLTTYQVFVRYFLKSPSSISETLTRYLFVWLVLLSATYIFGKREHICIEVVRNKFTGSAGRVLDVVIEGIIVVFAALVLIYGGSVITSMNMLQIDSILGIPTGAIYSVIPISGVLIILYGIFNISDTLGGKGAPV